jgi:hypothetical protein
MGLVVEGNRLGRVDLHGVVARLLEDDEGKPG